MGAGSPAATPAAEMEVEALFRRLRRLYWWSLGIALAAHLVLIAALATATRSAEDKIAEPAKTACRPQGRLATACNIQPAMGSMSMLTCRSGDFSTIPS